MQHEKPEARRRRVWLILLIVLALIAAGALGVLGVTLYRQFTPDPFNASSYRRATSSAASDALRDNPIDFDALRQENEDVCAWITVPGTLAVDEKGRNIGVDYPVVQSTRTNDNFYLDHSFTGAYNDHGALYIQRINSYDFSDPNTVIYGHNMLDGSMFRTLHNFRDPDFFAQNDVFYVYTPHHIMTYRIFAAYRYDNRHILSSFDFSNREVFADYLQSCLNPTSMIRNVREGVQLTADDKIVTLSTCISDARYRYLVQGVLIFDEETN